MSLYGKLKLSISGYGRRQPGAIDFGEGFDSILTQLGDSLITQNERLIVRQTVIYELLSQDDNFIVTQSDDIIQVRF